jgi:putative phage-type endonuclease
MRIWGESAMIYEIVCDSRDRDRWLHERTGGIGASESAAILGLNPWASPMSVWSDKLGLSETEQTEAMAWGLRLEPIIAKAYAEETGRKIQRWGKLLRSKEIPFLQATPDYRQRKPNPPVLEIKNVSGRTVEHWEGGIPEYVQCQVQHQLAVTGHKKATVAALIHGGRPVWLDIDRDQEFISGVLIPELEKFWAYVEAREPPPADSSPATARALRAMFPHESGETISLEPDFVDLDIRRQRLKEDAALLEKEILGIDNQIKLRIAENTRGICLNGVVYTLKTTNQAAYEVPAKSFRVLRRIQPKG